MKNITISITDEQATRLKRRQAETGVPVSVQIRFALDGLCAPACKRPDPELSADKDVLQANVEKWNDNAIQEASA